ncbi:MAG TPA: hypothetical protein DC024_01700 [Clostridiales bacterium]|jgi:hypothetical protein|nr:hypothetical protein [Clostridiales bacterium]
MEEITEEQILALTNNQKREEFLKTWPEWPVLAAVPALKLAVRQVVLPDRERIVSLEYAKTPFELHRHCYFQRLGLTEGISPFNDMSTGQTVEHLKNLRMKIVNQRKKED